MDTNRRNFWEGFEKRAGAPAAAGLAAGSAAFGGLYKLIRKGTNDPNATGIAKHLGNLARKAGDKHPLLGPLATWGIPAVGGAATGALVRKGVSHLAKKTAPKVNRLKEHLSNITEKIRKYFRKTQVEK